MKRGEFEHAVRAAGAVLGVRDVLVIGSQALHASVADELPPEASRSVEVDVAMLHDDAGGRMADLIDGSIGFESAGTNGVVAWCLDPHDLWVSKAVAGRPKALEFCQALLNTGLVHRDLLRTRLARVRTLDPRVRDAVAGRIAHGE